MPPQGAVRRLRPSVQFAPCGGMVEGLESVADQSIESRVLGEPALGSSLDPEGDNVGRLHVPSCTVELKPVTAVQTEFTLARAP